MTIRDALSWAENELRQIPEPRLDGEYLLSHVLKRERLPMLLDKMLPLADEDFSAYQALIARRKDREPLQWILGEQPFMGYSFKTDRRALIPRNDTEAVCEEALRHVRGKMQVLDLCCGTGAIGIAIKKLRPGCHVTLCDLSGDALSLARENAERLEADVRILQGDLFQPVAHEKFHLIVSNPPYIPDDLRGKLQMEVNKEPEMALFGGADGLDFYRIIAREAPRHLQEKGFLILECGDDQPGQIAALLADTFEDIAWIYDLNGHPRGVSARLK
ncbi:MAG: peptide chain release factor N(5)-glutamine methyltransferase [Clostridiales bacterium]|nr:peptide chain release factor N(5)-glutamine methyltransferase [Clostridiales bacterium]